MSLDNDIIAPSEAPLTHLKKTAQRSIRWDWRMVAVGLAVTAAVTLALTWRPNTSHTERQDDLANARLVPDQSATDRKPAQDNSLPPFEASQRALAQEQAQEALAAFVEKQIVLEQEMQVDSWGGDSLAEALNAAKQGDSAFVLEDFSAALAAYDQALDLISAVISEGENLHAEHLAATEAALHALDPKGARRAISSALMIKPQNSESLRLEARVDKLPEIQTLLRDAKNHELGGRFTEAVATYQTVASLDPETSGLEELIAAARQGQVGNDLQALLSEGFAALSAGRFDAARGAFNNALTVDPDNDMALGGLQQVAQENDLAIIRKYQAAGNAALGQEQWQAAQKSFRAILDMDNNIQFAKDGLSAAKEHQRIQTILTKISEQPQRLSTQSLFVEAQSIIAGADDLAHRGQTLNELITRGQRLLVLYKDPVDVTFLSDNATDIIVSNVGRLGRFETKILNLRPGQYTIRGSQSGCKDIYLSIEVIPGIDPVDVSCTERLASN